MRTVSRCLSLLLVALPALASAQPAASTGQKRVITHEDVFLTARVGAPAVSPDGSWAVVPVTQPAYEQARQTSDLWLVATDGRVPPRQLTHTRGSESGVAWSPDSTRIAYAAAGDDGPLSPGAQAGLAAAAGRPGLGDGTQIFVLDIASGTPRRVTNVSTGARTPQWRPDGRAILFVSQVFPGARTDDDNRKAAADRTGRKWTARVYDGFPIRDWDRWLDERRPSLLLQELDGTTPARDLLAGTPLMASPGFGGQSGQGSDGLTAVWADNTRVWFAATDNRHEAAFSDVHQALWLLDVATGAVARRTGTEGSYANPAVRATDGLLFARFEPNTDRTYNASRLMRMAPGGPHQVLATTFDASVTAFRLAPDGRSSYALAEDAGRQRLYRMSLDGAGTVTEVGRLDRGTLSAFDVGGPPAAPVIVATWESATNPPELVRIDAQSGARRVLTTFNAAATAALDLAPLEEFWFTSRKGRRIHSFVTLPPGYDPAKKYPLFVLIHGGPHGQWMDQWVVRWNYHLLAAPGYILLATNFTGSTGFGEQFAQNIQGDPLATPGEEVLEAVDEALDRYPAIDASRMAAGGASYGGHLTNWLAVTTSRFKALVSHAGLFDQVAQWTTSDIVYSREVNMGGPVWEGSTLWQSQNPILKSGALKTPMLVTAGERDFRVPLNNTLQLWSVLQRQKVPSRLVVFPDENHWILKGENSRFFYSEVHAWLARWLK